MVLKKDNSENEHLKQDNTEQHKSVKDDYGKANLKKGQI